MSALDEPCSQGDSRLHRAAPRAKILAFCALAVALAVGQSLAVAAAGVLLGIALTIWAGLRPGLVLARLLPANGFILFLWLLVPLTTPGETAWSFGPLTASVEGLRLAGLVTLKCNAILLCFLALAATSTLPALGRGMLGLGVPPKLCWMLLFSYRQLFIIRLEYLRLTTAARLRGFVPTTSPRTYRTFANLFAMTLVRSWTRGQRVRQAMLLRGFDGSFRSLELERAAPGDWFIALALLCLAAGFALFGLR
jgi:cobalt/nickel transport system permease protein